MKFAKFITMAGLAFFGAGLANAQPTGSISSLQIHELVVHLPQADRNKDGFITRQEWIEYRASQFLRLDRNGDGFLSLDDIPVFMRCGDKAQMLQQTVVTFDRNGDGRLSRDEFVRGPTAAFDRVDLDHNGVIDAYEIKQAQSLPESH